MGQKENKLKNKTLAELPANMRMFRANAGIAWVGKIIKHALGIIILKNPRPFHGLPVGFSDLFGWTSINVTPDMIGQKIAIFTAYELKATGKLTKEQRDFRRVLLEMGGIFEEIKE